MYDASTGDEVLYVSSDSTSLAITFSGNELTLTAEADFMFIIKRSNSSYVESYSPSDGTGAINIPVVVKMKKQIESISEYNITFAESSGATKVSVDLTTLPGWASLSSGSHNITIVAKADGYRDSEPSAAVSVTKSPAVTLINFTIARTSYQAEEGMTWAEWVNSSYNTGGFINDITKILSAVGAPVKSSGTVVSPSDSIIENTAYTLGPITG